MSVVEVKIPYSEWTQEMKDSFNKRKSGNKNESLYLRVRKNLKENTYMALLDRTYKPTERDYVKYAIDTPEGRKKFDLDLMMVENFIKRKKPRIHINPILHGGGHEYGYRSGTLPVHNIVGFGKACEIANVNYKSDNKHLKKLSTITRFY